jgi:FHS family L-fucose permease-like MFS transporter
MGECWTKGTIILFSTVTDFIFSIGTVVAPVIGSYAIFNHVGNDQRALENVQWIYLAIACFVFLLAIVFYLYVNDLLFVLTGITDPSFELSYSGNHGRRYGVPGTRNARECRCQAFQAAIPLVPRCVCAVLLHRRSSWHCWLRKCTIPMLYPNTVNTNTLPHQFINYVIDADPKYTDATAAQMLAGAQGGFALGRFVGTFIMKFVRPRWVFIVYLAMCIVFVAPSITHGGNPGIALLFVTLFFESIIFPTIVALGMRGLGKHSKRGSGWIVGAVCGGAVVPPILGAAADSRNSTQFGMVVPLCFFIAAFSYAICVNFVPSYRDTADAFSETKVGVENVGAKDEEKGSPGVLGEKGFESGEAATHDEVREVGKA